MLTHIVSVLAELRDEAALPPPLAGATTGQVTVTNRAVVSSVDRPCHLFATPGRSLPPASSPRHRRAWL
jgi:hypothetical protein